MAQMPFDVSDLIPIHEPTPIIEEPVILESIGEINHDIIAEEMHNEDN